MAVFGGKAVDKVLSMLDNQGHPLETHTGRSVCTSVERQLEEMSEFSRCCIDIGYAITVS